MAFNVITIGDISIDEFIKISDASVDCDINHKNCKLSLSYASKIPVDQFETNLGGNAANVAIACTKLGMTCAIYTELGADTYGEQALKILEKERVDISFCNATKNIPTNVHAVLVFKGERTILSYHAPREYKLPTWDPPTWIYYTSLSENFANCQKELIEYMNKNPSIMLAFNPGTMHLKTGVAALTNVLEIVDVLFVNKEEARSLTNITTDAPLELHQGLQKMGPKLTVITDGENGSSAFDGKNLAKFGIFENIGDIIDKTGAGDAFAAAFLAALHNNKSLDTALRWGSSNAAGVITKIGATQGQKTKEELESTC